MTIKQKPKPKRKPQSVEKGRDEFVIDGKYQTYAMKPKPKRKRSQWPKYYHSDVTDAIYRSTNPKTFWISVTGGWRKCWFSMGNHQNLKKLPRITRAEAKRLGAKV